MFLFYFAISITVLSSALYHVAQKMTPTNVNPMLALAVTYAMAMVICLVLLPFYPSSEGILTTLGQLNWTSVVLAFAVFGLEIGFLLAYRAGWNISLAVLTANVAAALVLLPVGLLFFKDRLSPENLIGIAVCILGLVMINQR